MHFKARGNVDFLKDFHWFRASLSTQVANNRSSKKKWEGEKNAVEPVPDPILLIFCEHDLVWLWEPVQSLLQKARNIKSNSYT